MGTASWTDPTLLASGWYPPGVRNHPERRLRYYAQHFDTVEVDSTFYALPRLEVVRKWAERTPEGFLFHVKAYSAFTGHGLEASALPTDLQALLPQKEGHLSQREVPEEVVEEVLPEARVEEALAVLRRYRHREDKARAVRFLEGRGFPLGVALEAWRLAQEEGEGYK